MRIGVIADAIPKFLVFDMHKGIIINGVVGVKRTLLNRKGALIKNHVIPVAPVTR
jgi:hypothetical protein